VEVLDVIEGTSHTSGRWIEAVIAHRRCPIILTSRGRAWRDGILAATAAATVIALVQLAWYLR
jgi:hypothetical protein